MLLFGFTAILGKLITLPSFELVWYRMLIATVTLLVVVLFTTGRIKNVSKQIIPFFGVGLIVAAHWVLFFEAIKVSNVSVTLGCMASGTLFASLLEPIFKKRKIDWLEVVIGLFIILGLYLIFQFELEYRLGIMLALVSAFLAVLFTLINEGFVRTNDAITVSGFEMLGGFIGLSIYLIVFQNMIPDFQIIWEDWMYLLILGILCTGVAFVLSIAVMKTLSPYFVVLAVNLEPIYGIVLAWFIFGESEQMTNGFYIGAGIILLSVFLYPILKRQRTKEHKQK